MRLSFLIAMTVVAYGLLVALVYQAVAEITSSKIEACLAAVARSTLEKEFEGTLEGVIVQFDGFEGEIGGLIDDAERREAIAAAVTRINTARNQSLVTLHERIRRSARCLVEGNAAVVRLRGDFPDARSHAAVLVELERYAGELEPEGRVVDEVLVDDHVHAEVAWMGDAPELIRYLLPKVRELQLSLVANRQCLIRGKVDSEELRQAVYRKLDGQFPGWKVAIEKELIVDPPKPTALIRLMTSPDNLLMLEGVVGSETTRSAVESAVASALATGAQFSTGLRVSPTVTSPSWAPRLPEFLGHFLVVTSKPSLLIDEETLVIGGSVGNETEKKALLTKAKEVFQELRLMDQLTTAPLGDNAHPAPDSDEGITESSSTR